VFKVKLDCLENRGQIATGDAEFCALCKGVFNQLSKLADEGDKQVWLCEFCNHKNEVMIGPEEVPQAPEVTYILEAAAQVEQLQEETKQAAAQQTDTISIVFCIDISGSMSGGMRLSTCKTAVAQQVV